MARPQKAGIDYFPLDVYMEQDDKIALIEARHGIIGFGTIIKLYKKIYGGNGYYYEWNERNKLLFSKYAGVELTQLEAIIDSAIEWDLFDKKLFNTYGILTSKRIQRTYFDASYRKKQVEFYKEFLLNGINADINRDNVVINSINDSNNPQIKLNESKLNNISTLGADVSKETSTPEPGIDNPDPFKEPEKPKSNKPKKDSPNKRIKFDRTPDIKDAKFIGITQGDIDAWEKAYPAADLDAEVAKAIVWIYGAEAKGYKSKWYTFLNGWFNRTQNSGGTKNGRI